MLYLRRFVNGTVSWSVGTAGRVAAEIRTGLALAGTQRSPR